MSRYLFSRLHISWFIAALSLGIIAGTVLCLVVELNVFAHISWLIIAFVLAVPAVIKRLRLFIGMMVLAGLLIGLWRGSIAQQQFAEFIPYYEQIVALQGKVVDDTSYGERGDQRLRLGNIQINQQQLNGEVWASLPAKADIKRGDFVQLEGKLGDGFGNNQAAMYRAELRDIIRPHPGDIGRQVRDWFASGVKRSIPEPGSSLGLGYLTGQKNALPETLEQQIRTVGLTHVVVASGFNLMILVTFARMTLSRISKYLAAASGAAMIAGFMAITGFSPSMSRAGLVAGLGLLAWYYGRKMHPLVLLPFAAAATLLYKPSYIWGDIGWFLSFTAFIGIIVLAPLLHDYFWGIKNKPGPLRELIVSTMSAQILTLPIVMFVFGQYSSYALLANLLVLPIIPFAMLFTFVAGTCALIIPGLASVFGFPALVLLQYSTIVIEKIASLPYALGEIELAASWLAASYVVMVAILLYFWHKTKHDFIKN